MSNATEKYGRCTLQKLTVRLVQGQLMSDTQLADLAKERMVLVITYCIESVKLLCVVKGCTHAFQHARHAMPPCFMPCKHLMVVARKTQLICGINSQQSGGRQLYLTEIACQLPVVGSIHTDTQGCDVALTCIVVGAPQYVI